MYTSTCDFEISCLILGAMLFGMAFFWLLNHTNTEIQSYAWHVVSTSTVLFLAVLIGHSWTDLIALLVLPPYPYRTAEMTIFVGACSLAGWQLTMQLVLARICGAFGHKPKNRFSTVLRLKCWAVLLGLICAIASTQLWAFVQMQVPKTVVANLGVIVASGLSMWLLFTLTDLVRARLLAWNNMPMDEYKLMWKKHASEQEDIAITITIAKLAVIALQTWLSGFLPLTEDEEHSGGGAERFVFSRTTASAALMLVLVGAVQACLIPVVDALVPDSIGRWKLWVTKCFGMGIAYSLLHGFEALLDSLTGTGPFGGVVCASLITLLTFVVIFAADYVSPVQAPSTEFEGDLFLVQPLSILVAFSWAGAFARALRIIVTFTHMASDSVETIVLSVAFAVLVVPTWQRNVLPNTMRKEIHDYMKKGPRYRKTYLLKTSSSLQKLHNMFAFHAEANRPLLRLDSSSVSATSGSSPTFFNQQACEEDDTQTQAMQALADRVTQLEQRNAALVKRLAQPAAPQLVAVGEEAKPAAARDVTLD